MATSPILQAVYSIPEKDVSSSQSQRKSGGCSVFVFVFVLAQVTWLGDFQKVVVEATKSFRIIDSKLKGTLKFI